LRFPRDRRLLNERNFRRVFERGVRVSNAHFTILTLTNELHRPRLGLVVAKHKTRTGVERNRIKRHVRESFRLSQDALPAADYVVLARDAAIGQAGPVLRRSLHQLWSKLRHRAPPNQGL
jgi:ribonuclease P protein component